jgi:3'(2'), 5'-bisphosphate nucleotidase
VFTVAGSRSHMNPETEAYIEQCRRLFGEVAVHSSGSSLKICHVAEGLADVYPRIAPTSEWDVAAGHAVVEAAGGACLRAGTTDPLAYNKPALLNPSFVCVSRRYLGSVPPG